MRQYQSILEYRRGLYLKLALALCVGAVVAYAWHEPPVTYPKPYGGTWLGYTLGTICAVLVLWLMMLGVRKRSYRSTLGTVQGWTSAHVLYRCQPGSARFAPLRFRVRLHADRQVMTACLGVGG